MPYLRMSSKDVAEYLHLPVAEVERLAQHGEIPCQRAGERLVFVKRDIAAWASQRILGLPTARLEQYHRKTSAVAHDLSPNHAIIRELVRAEGVSVRLASRTKPSLLRDMTALGEKTGLVAQAGELLRSLREREALCSTGLPGGLALLHPRHHDPYLFSDSFIAFARSAGPLPFGAPDGEGTDLFFLVCCQDDRIHLHALARLCTMCVKTKLLATLREAESAVEIVEAITKSEEAVLQELRG